MILYVFLLYTIMGSEQDGIYLELGDIIELNAPQNQEIHEETFFITYIDDSKIRLSNISSFQPYLLRISPEGVITDESIKHIELVSRSEEAGYARQHLLLPQTWVDVHFSGDVPTIITGEITNLEEDMIEITTYPDMDVIYIDFAYQGVPENIPLDKIVIRTKPVTLTHVNSLVSLRFGQDESVAASSDETDTPSIEFTETGESVIRLPTDTLPDPHIRDVLHGMYLDANEIVFGEDFDVVQVVEVPEGRRRYDIETQANSMMDELLSSIPNTQRNQAVLNNIHTLIERFKELRTQYSRFDELGNVVNIKTVGPVHKPLVDRILHLDQRLRWLVPVVAHRRKLYADSSKENGETNGLADEYPASMGQDLSVIENAQTDYFENRIQGDTIKYDRLCQTIHPVMTPFMPPLGQQASLASNIPIATALESIVQNLEDFYSTVVFGDKLARRRFVIQKYSLGMTKMMPVVSEDGGVQQRGRRIAYARTSLTEPDKMSIKSIMMLPEPVVRFSQIDFPGTSMMDRSSLGQNWFYMFRLLREKTTIQQYIIEQFDKEIDDESMLSTLKEFVLDESLEQDPDRFRQFLETVLPQSRSLIRLVRKYIHNRLSFVEVVKTLEPFSIYSRDLTYPQFMEIRYFIKERIAEHKKTIAKRMAEFAFLKNTRYPTDNINLLNRIERIMEKREFLDIFHEEYGWGNDRFKTSSEWMSKIAATDQGRLFSTIVKLMMISLITPESILSDLGGEHEDMGKDEKVKAKDCSRRFLTKRYTSIKDMQADNKDEPIYYDAELDDTPYALFSKYKEDKKRFSPEAFVDFLAESLVQKHDCPRALSAEMAATLIAGKKEVRDGEYAVVEMRPHLPEGLDQDTLTEKERKAAEMEANLRKRTQYYRRVRNHWVHDDTVDEQSFLDNNTLICNMGRFCYKNAKTAVCETTKTAEERMRDIARRRIQDEFDRRFDTSFEGLKEAMEAELEVAMRRLNKQVRLTDVQTHRANNLAFEMGKYVRVRSDEVVSPYITLREMILGQDDFVKRQSDIVRFVDTYTRDPMVDELAEDFHWYYCKETNTRLLPKFFYVLALEFNSGGDFQRKQDELCRKQGVLSEDGDAIVDRHSGYVIRKIDFVDEEGYDDAGFKIVTNEILEKDVGVTMMEAAATGKRKDRVFENDTAETVFRIYAAMAVNVGIPLDSIEDMVLRLSTELIAKNVISDAAYEKRAVKLEKEKGKRPVPYTIYCNQSYLAIVSAVLLVGIQTAVPGFKIRKTFPGCIRSFSGYPETGEGDVTGLQYMACVLNKTKSSIPPWNSIERLNPTLLQGRIREVLEKYVVTRPDIMELYVKKREYAMLHPDEFTIPEDHNVAKWVHFMPPVIPFSVVNGLRGLSGEFKTELMAQIREGAQTQHNLIATARAKVASYGFGTIEAINAIVTQKDLLLKTASRVLFLENACCNETKTARTLDYFLGENRAIDLYVKVAEKWGAILENVREMTRAAMYYHPKNTAIVYPPIPQEHFEENVYAAFIHHCNFDSDLPIPLEIRDLVADKPGDDYKRSWTLVEKIEYLKQNGKRYKLGDLVRLMGVIYSRNILHVGASAVTPSAPVKKLNDLLEYFDAKDSTVVESALRRRLAAVLTHYNPKVMIAEDSEETKHLNNYLQKSNARMTIQILDFFRRYTKMGSREKDQIESFIESVGNWPKSMYMGIQFLQNAIYTMTKVFPESIRNGNVESFRVPKHWGLSDNHKYDIATFLKKFYEPIQKYKNDPVLVRLLQETHMRQIDLYLLAQSIPTPASIKKGDVEYYTSFTERTIFYLLTYVWLSVLYDTILATDDVDLLRADVNSAKAARMKQIAESTAAATAAATAATEEEEDASALDEIQIVVGNKEELKTRVAGMLTAMLTIEGENRRAVDITYDEIDARVRQSKQEEKIRITDFFKAMDSEERRVEDLKKNYRLGRWNVGLQKGLVKYDKETYDREREDFLKRMAGLDVEERVEDNQLREVEDLIRDAEMDADADGDAEAFDIGGLGEDYMDGNYYHEDRGDDDF